MHSASSHSDQNQTSLARFGFSHGYRLEGDSALLNAHIDLSPSAARVASSFALQLWACEEPHRGGPLSGFKIAEAPISLSGLDAASRLDAVAFAHPPAAALTRISDARDSVSRDFSMVLVLAAGAPGAFDQVHDFANYPARERFVVPHLGGAAGYKLHDDGSVSLHVEQVFNPRSADNLSGSLSLQLWSVDKPYAGGELNGTLLATRELGQVRGQESITVQDELRSVLTRAVGGASHLVLALCEWTALGYLARDYCNFAEPQRAAAVGERPEAAASSVSAPSKVLAAPSVAAQAPAKVAAAAPAVAATAPAPSKDAPAAPAVAAAAPAQVVPAAASVAAEAPAKVAAAPNVAAQAPAKAPEAAASAPAQAPVKVEAAPAAALPPSASAKGALPSLNTISEDDLVKLAGISKKLAGQILKGRPYKSLDELRSVRGIGDKTVFGLRKLLTV
jgi:DNA uptake protein ComE-like DNA-binding protein